MSVDNTRMFIFTLIKFECQFQTISSHHHLTEIQFGKLISSQMICFEHEIVGGISIYLNLHLRKSV